MPVDPSDMPILPAGLTQARSLEVPVIVRLGQCAMNVRKVLDLVPGSIIELATPADSELQLLVNNKQIGFGNAVKVGENFGIRITYIGDVAKRPAITHAAHGSEEGPIGSDAAALAEALLAGQS
jgi:flagellar motor switch protein FliN/FliY